MPPSSSPFEPIITSQITAGCPPRPRLLHLTQMTFLVPKCLHTPLPPRSMVLGRPYSVTSGLVPCRLSRVSPRTLFFVLLWLCYSLTPPHPRG